MKITMSDVVNLSKWALRKLSLVRNTQSNSDYVRTKKELRDEKDKADEKD